MDEFRKYLLAAAAAVSLPLEQELADRLACHWQLLLAANERFNITAITEPRAAAEKHYLDCLLAADKAARLLPWGGSAADIGSGGGFPGLIMAAACPDIRFTLIEAMGKKADFLTGTVAAMELANVTVRTMRAEEAGRHPELRGGFALATARAVAELAVLAEYALPLLAEDGVFLAMKGPGAGEELAAAAKALEILGGELTEKEEYVLPEGSGRTLLVFRKTAPTPEKYPRRPGMPTKRPL